MADQRWTARAKKFTPKDISGRAQRAKYNKPAIKLKGSYFGLSRSRVEGSLWPGVFADSGPGPGVLCGRRGWLTPMPKICLYSAIKRMTYGVSPQSVRPCLYYNLATCTTRNVHWHHYVSKGSSRVVYHICAICHAAVNLHEAHTALKCPQAQIKHGWQIHTITTTTTTTTITI